jgi:hypothetical protein
LWDLKTAGYYIKLMWIPSHVGIMGNETADEGAKRAALSGICLEIPPQGCDFKMLARRDMLNSVVHGVYLILSPPFDLWGCG